MADTYTTASKALLPEDGSRSGAWAIPLNTLSLELIDDMASGTENINLGTSTTRSMAALGNGTDSESRASYLNFTGTPASAVTITVPASVANKRYLIYNNTGQRMTVKYAASTGVVLGNLDRCYVWCNGTEVYDQGPGSRITTAEIAASVTPVNYAYQARPWLDLKREGCLLDGTTDDYAAFNRCVSVAASTNTSMVIDGPMKLSTSITVPANVHLLFVGAGQLLPDAAKTVTFNGTIDAIANNQIFAGSGTVLLSKTTNPVVWANWFAGADIGAKINAATASAGGSGPLVVKVATGSYSYSTAISFLNMENIRLTGPGANMSTLNGRNPALTWTGGAGTGPAIAAPGAIGLEIDHLTIGYSAAAFNGVLLSLAKGAGTLDTTTCNVHHNAFLGDGGITAASTLIELNSTERCSIEKNSFRYGVTAIKATGASCNVVSIKDNWFQSDFTGSKISGQGNAWTIEGNVDENGASIIALFDLSGDMQGLSIIGNQSVDGGASGGTIIDLHGTNTAQGVKIAGNSLTAASGTAILMSETVGKTSGVEISGNYIGGMATGIDINSSENISVHGNNMAACTTPWKADNALRLNIGENDFGTTTTSGIPVADTATILLSRTTSRASGIIEVYSIEDDAQAIYMLNGTGNSVNEISDPAGLFTAASGGAASINIYYSAGNARYELQNLRGATRTLVVNSRFGR